MQVSAYSPCEPHDGLQAAVRADGSRGRATFDATLSSPIYDWMGVSKAALESASRYLARYLGPEGVRCNLVAAGPLETIAKKAIPGSEEFNNIWVALRSAGIPRTRRRRRRPLSRC